MREWINNKNGFNYNIKRIRRIMKELNITSVIRRKRKGFKKVKPEIEASNLLNRDFKASYPNEKWVTDITEIKVGKTSKRIFLSAILDLYDKSIIAFKISSSNNNALVFKTLDEAIKKNPECKALLHSDRGVQYTSLAFRRRLDELGMTQSMSRPGKCIDNGPMEGFFGILKSEMVDLRKANTIKELTLKIRKYIHFYNNERIHGSLKGHTPVKYRMICLERFVQK